MYTVPKLETYSADELDRAVAELLSALEAEVTTVADDAQWQEFRNRWTARKNGVLTQVNDGWLKAAPGPQKREVGQRVNQVRQKVEAVVEETKESLSGTTSDKRLAAERVDITPSRHRAPAGRHAIRSTHVWTRLIGVFGKMGYSVAEGPEIETDYYNFEALNFPLNHPARDMQDTLFIAGQEKKHAARPPAAAHAHVAGADPHHGDAASRRCASSVPARCIATTRPTPRTRRSSTSSKASRRYEHHLRRPEGHARSRHEVAVRLGSQDQLPAVVLSRSPSRASKC